MNYYIGDLHLFNRNQTDEGRNYDGRPFATVEEMNQYILERWNAKINNGDTVYILGDMAMRGKNNALLALVAQLKGKKILFRGNHDDLSDYRYQRLFEEVTDYREIADSFDGKTYKLCLMHYPILMWNGSIVAPSCSMPIRTALWRIPSSRSAFGSSTRIRNWRFKAASRSVHIMSAA